MARCQDKLFHPLLIQSSSDPPIPPVHCPMFRHEVWMKRPRTQLVSLQIQGGRIGYPIPMIEEKWVIRFCSNFRSCSKHMLSRAGRHCMGEHGAHKPLLGAMIVKYPSIVFSAFALLDQKRKLADMKPRSIISTTYSNICHVERTFLKVYYFRVMDFFSEDRNIVCRKISCDVIHWSPQ